MSHFLAMHSFTAASVAFAILERRLFMSWLSMPRMAAKTRGAYQADIETLHCFSPIYHRVYPYTVSPYSTNIHVGRFTNRVVCYQPPTQCGDGIMNTYTNVHMVKTCTAAAKSLLNSHEPAARTNYDYSGNEWHAITCP